MNLHGETLTRKRSITRKISALPEVMRQRILSQPKAKQQECVAELQAEHVKQQHNLLMDAWKEKAKTWRSSVRSVCAFIRNPSPAKMCVLDNGGHLESSPNKIQSLLRQTWGEIESWPTEVSEQAALLALEDKYSFLLPRLECSPLLTHDMVIQAAKATSVLAPGLDAWTIPEAEVLPPQAWEALLNIVRRSPDQLKAHLVTLVKRVPLEKHAGICTAKDVRPIDLFSVLLRILSSAAYNLAKPWACAVLHPNQCATQGGIIHALSRVALQTECALTNSKSILAVASDFSKMFNMMATSVSSAVAGFMGLAGNVLSFLTKPLDLSSYAWKLPFNARPIEEQHGRGLPQGMAGSVMLAELSIAPLLWRCQSVLTSAPHSIVAYVDDLHFFTADSSTLNRILELLFEFQSDFRLDLSRQKSAIWGNDHAALRRVAEHYGIPHRMSIEALGADWPVDSRAKPSYTKEVKRIEEAEKRILSVRHLPVDLATKYEAISMACLSLLDYVNHPRMENVRALRMLVKRSLGQRFAAPEILYNCLQASSIDPCIRWLLASLRLWFHVLKIGEDHDVLARIVRMCKGRLGWASESLPKQKIHVAAGGVWVGESFFPIE